MQEGKYFKVEQLMAMAIVQGGSGLPFFAPSVYKYLCGSRLEEICVEVDEVPNIEVKQLLHQVSMIKYRT